MTEFLDCLGSFEHGTACGHCARCWKYLAGYVEVHGMDHSSKPDETVHVVYLGESAVKARIEALTADNERLQSRVDVLEEVLQWYGENARLARLIHSEGDAGRHALAADGGKRARAALKETDHD